MKPIECLPLDQITSIGPWTVDHGQYRLTSEKGYVVLDHNQFTALLLLASNEGQTVSKEQLLVAVWGKKIVTEDSLYVLINGLRKVLGDNARQPNYIRTVSGKGYQCIAKVNAQVVISAPAHRHFYRRWGQQWNKGWLWGLVVVSALVGVMWWAKNVSTLPLSTQDVAHSTAQSVLSDAAREQYLRANYLLTRQPPEKAEALAIYQQIMAAYPDYADVYVKWSAAKMLTIFNSDPLLVVQKEEIKGALLYALALDPTHKEAHKLLGNLYFMLFRDYQSARLHFEQALGVADAHYFYSQFLLAMGEFDAAKRQLETYIQLYPQGYSGEGAAWIYTMAGHYTQASQQLDKLAAFADDNFYYHVSRQAIYELTGEEDKAFYALHQLMEKAGYTLVELKQVTALFDRNGLAGVYHWLAFEDIKHLNIGQYSPPLSLARYAIATGDDDAAVTWLEQAYTQGRIELLWLAVDPKYKPLKGHPRFIHLLEELGLKPLLTSN